MRVLPIGGQHYTPIPFLHGPSQCRRHAVSSRVSYRPTRYRKDNGVQKSRIVSQAEGFSCDEIRSGNDNKRIGFDVDVLLVDEIGKMELFSKSFTEKVDEMVFRDQVGKKMRCMLATIPEIAPAHLILIQKLRSNPCCKIFEVHYGNRDMLPEEISQIIFRIIREK